MRLIAPVITAAVVLAGAPAAQAADWSRPTRLPAQANAMPRAAIARDGTSVTVRVGPDGDLVATVGDPRGRLGRSMLLTRRRVFDYAAAAAPHGAAAVAYEARDGLHIAVRQGRRFRDRVIPSTGSEINGVAIAADAPDGWVVAERQQRRGDTPYHVRAVSLSVDGVPVGPVQDLGSAEFGIYKRVIRPLVVRADGRAVLAVESATGGLSEQSQLLISTRPHGGAFSAFAAIGPNLADPTVSTDGDRAVVGALAVHYCGDDRCYGSPVASVVGSDGTPGLLAGPKVDNPPRAVAPSATSTAQVFSQGRGGIYASHGGAVQRLGSGSFGSDPVVTPVLGGDVAIWSTSHGFQAARAATNGRFHRISAPAGPPPPRYNYAPYSDRDYASAGRYMIVAWSRGNTVRVSTCRF